MGAKTHAAIRMFQREQGLAVTGELDQETYDRLLTPPPEPKTPAPRPAEAPPEPSPYRPASPNEQASSPSPEYREPAGRLSRTPLAPFVIAALFAIIGMALLRRRSHEKTSMGKSHPEEATGKSVATNIPGTTAALSLHKARVDDVSRDQRKAQAALPVRNPAAPVTGKEQAPPRPSATTIADDAIRRVLAIQAGRPAPLPNPDAGLDGGDVNWTDLGLAGASPPPRPREPAAKGMWIPKSQSIRVGDFALPAGMIYVGQIMAPLQGQGTDRCLIDP
jgi:hypothetical protein